MDKPTVEKAKAKLQELKLRYEEQIKQAKSDVEEDYNVRGDEGDHAAAATRRSIANARRNMAQNQLLLISQALNRIEGGTYGICDNCGDPIDAERILAIPTAIHCVGCLE